MARKKELRLIITFHTTTDAIAAEKAFREHGLPGRTIPVPRQISASCGISWSTETGKKDDASEILKNIKVDPEGYYEVEVAV